MNKFRLRFRVELTPVETVCILIGVGTAVVSLLICLTMR